MKLSPYLLGLALAMNLTLWAASRDADWRKVEEAMTQRLPQTALKALEPILEGAVADQAWAETVKAIAYQSVLEGQVQGNKPEERIRRLEAELARAPKQIGPMLETVLAHNYWQYFQMNRWRFLRRTATQSPAGPDFTTWDLSRLFAEIDRHFTAALRAAPQLQAIPIAAYDVLLPKGDLPDRYRPTLYDFLAQEALQFYTSGEQAGALPEGNFDVEAASPILGTRQEFLSWQPGPSAGAAPSVDAPPFVPAWKAIRLYQDLLRFHERDTDPTAALDVDLARLVWGYNVAVGEEREARYRAALEAFAKEWGHHALSAMALYHQARLRQADEEPAEAHQLARRGRDAHPESPGGILCANVIAQIEARSARMMTERIWNAPWPRIQVHYRNVTNLYFRAVEWDWDEFLERRHRRPENLSDAERKAVLAKTPAHVWSHPLAPTSDFKERTVELAPPVVLKPGFYFLVASHNPAFEEPDNQLSMVDIWVSDLALVIRIRSGEVGGFVLEAESGEPVVGARVQSWYLSNQGNRVALPETVTDGEGVFSLSGGGRRPVLIKATAEGQSVATANDHAAWEEPEREATSKQTVFFTDRAIYRPGQTIQYKGICLRVDQEKDRYTVLAAQRLAVQLRDPNGEVVATHEHQANDYGSFSGSFVAPGGRLLGALSLAVSEGPPGEASVRVEEYKRPKFHVALDAPKEPARLNAPVVLTGQAQTYTGSAVDGGAVSYRVYRQARMPWWWGLHGSRRGAWRHGASKEIAHGKTQTDAQGRFTVPFHGEPDARVPEKDEPTFVFEVTADVTDSAGETRSAARSVPMGYTALEARLEADSWLTEDQAAEVRVRTTSLDGEGTPSEGIVRVTSLTPPERVVRPGVLAESYDVGPLRADRTVPEEARDLSDPADWPRGQTVLEQGLNTDPEGKGQVAVTLSAGFYRAELETKDRFGRRVTSSLVLRILRPAASQCPLRVANVVDAPKDTVEPGSEFQMLWGTGYEKGRAYVEVEHRGRILRRLWTPPGQTQVLMRQAVTEEMRGGFTVHVTQVRENRAYLTTRRVAVPWNDRVFNLRWEHFTSKMQPGQPETWTLLVEPPGLKGGPKPGSAGDGPAGLAPGQFAAELVATLYDASLDAFAPHEFPGGFGVFREDVSFTRHEFANGSRMFSIFRSSWHVTSRPVGLRYRSFPEILAGRGRYGPLSPRRFGANDAMVAPPMSAMAPQEGVSMLTRGGGVRYDSAPGTVELGMAAKAAAPVPAEEAGGAPAPGERLWSTPDPSRVSARKNLQETAFFLPQLTTDSNGTVRIAFTMPEALTEWRFLGFAHDRALRSGRLEGKTVTAKDLMVQPNPPRFLREGDELEFTVKVSNQGDRTQQGKVRLTLANALTGAPADASVGNTQPEQAFDVPARESRSYSWRLTVPDGTGFLTYKAVAASAELSDGEEGVLPVLPRRMLVTESLPLPIRGPATQTFAFKQLEEAGASKTLQHESLTVQMVSNPAWYAVMALPYLMEFPHECAEQTFNRLYANALGQFLAHSDPKIRQVFDLWKNTKALDSPLEKNPELKGILLEETPWLRQAHHESESRRNLGVLFDDRRLAAESELAMRKLAETQLPDGAWPWFPGGPANDFMTLYITTGFGRLRHLGVEVDAAPAVRALSGLDAWLEEEHRRILEHGDAQTNHLNPRIALYLYGRTFFLKDQPVAPSAKNAFDYFVGQAQRYWVDLRERQSEAHVALALHRLGDTNTPPAIVRSLKERSVVDAEMGRFWRDTELSWWWYRAPIETQALMIEAFVEVAKDGAAVEECQVWLLKQKQTRDWKTTKATADAVYALLLRGRSLLASDALVEIELGGQWLAPRGRGSPRNDSAPAPAVEPGTGFYEHRFAAGEIQPDLGRITVRKTDAGVAWGSVHWQYFEDMANLKPYEGTPLKLRKALFVKRNTARGPVLEPVTGPMAPGDELVVRLELRVDRDMEYVHLKDQRGSGVEPVKVLSEHRYQDGLGYYESTRDTATHFFIDYLPKGTYVLESSGRVQHRGEYQTGVASIQCLYAPEFNSHSESLRLVVK